MITCDAIQTTANTATPDGTVRMFSSHDQSALATGSIARPAGRTATRSAAGCAPKTRFESESIVMGTTTPAATRPESLFSTVFSTSSCLLVPVGNTVPRVSFAVHAAASNSAGSPNLSYANHGNAARARDTFS